MSILKARKPRENTNPRVSQFKDEIAKGGRDKVKFSMNIPRAMHAEFRRKSFLANKDMKDILLDAIKKYLAEKS